MVCCNEAYFGSTLYFNNLADDLNHYLVGLSLVIVAVATTVVKVFMVLVAVVVVA